MTVETATYISQLNSALPSGTDPKSEGDDHLRLLKSTILASFPGITGAMTATHTQLNNIVSAINVNTSAPANSLSLDANSNLLGGTLTSFGAPSGNGWFICGASANIGIGIGHAAGTGSGQAYANYYYAGGLIGSITQNGTTGVTYNTTSDYRLKLSPVPVQDSGAIIDKGNPVRWTWAQDGAPGIGFLAHEMQVLLPGAVTGVKDQIDVDGKPIYQSMEYGNSGIIAVMWAELKSLRARVKALEHA